MTESSHRVWRPSAGAHSLGDLPCLTPCPHADPPVAPAPADVVLVARTVAVPRGSYLETDTWAGRSDHLDGQTDSWLVYTPV
jgi:hypothetical protein